MRLFEVQISTILQTWAQRVKTVKVVPTALLFQAKADPAAWSDKSLNDSL